MVTSWANWEHVTKIDPDKPLHDGDTYPAIADTGTDALIIGGTTNVRETRIQPINERSQSKNPASKPESIPTTAEGPSIPKKGYLVDEIAEDLYYITDGTFQSILLQSYRSARKMPWSLDPYFSLVTS